MNWLGIGVAAYIGFLIGKKGSLNIDDLIAQNDEIINDLKAKGLLPE